MNFVMAFLFGGAICALGQVLIDKTHLTPARIMVGFVTLGVVLGGLGLWKPVTELFGAGATVPLIGFGNLLATGVRDAVDEHGLSGILTGGLGAAAGGVTAAIVCGYLAGLLFRPHGKK